MVFSTDNQIRNYVYSKIKPNSNNYSKIQTINDSTLDSIFKNSPNTQLYFLSYYCVPCCKKLISGSNFDTIKKQNVIYFTVDNLNAIKNIASLVESNSNINLVYSLDDNYFKGMYHQKGNDILTKYCPVPFNKSIYPFILTTDSFSNIMGVRQI